MLALATTPKFGSAWMVTLTSSSHSDELGVETASSVLALVAVLQIISQNLNKFTARQQLILGVTRLRSRCPIALSCSQIVAIQRSDNGNRNYLTTGIYSPSRLSGVASPLALLVVESRTQANKGRAVGTDVILVGAELAAFGSDSLELLLRRGIGVSNIHEKSLFSNTNAVELANDLITNIARLETRKILS